MFFWKKIHKHYSITIPTNIFQEIGINVKSKNVISHEIFCYINQINCIALYRLLNNNDNNACRICKIYSHVTEPILKITRIDLTKSINDCIEIDYYRECQNDTIMPGLCIIGRFQYQIALCSKETTFETRQLNEFNFIAEGWWYFSDNIYTYYGIMSDDIKNNGTEPRYFLYKRKDVHNQTVPWNKTTFANYEIALNNLKDTRLLTS